MLHIANFAEIEIVKASYKAMTKLYHPDVNKNIDPNVIVKINLAYEILGNQEKKKIYDKELLDYLKKQTTQYNHENQEKSYSSEINKETKEESLSNRFAKFIINTATVFANSYAQQANEIKQITENAYYRGSSMSDEQLIRNFLRSKGAKRNGYAQVLIERTLLYKENGKLVPSYTFMRITKNLK